MKRKKRFADADEMNPVGRPAGSGDYGTKLTVRIPTALADAMTTYANQSGTSASEAWRRAAQAFLGLSEEA